MTTKQFIEHERKEWFPGIESLDRDIFPHCGNLSGAFFYRLLPNPVERFPPEVIHVKTERTGESMLELTGFIASWNMAWESGHLRPQMFARKEFPEEVKWLRNCEDANIYLVPHSKSNNYYAHQHLLNLLPAKTREKFGLPCQKRCIWPASTHHWYLERVLPKDFDERLSSAFAYHVWPLLNSGSRLNRFSDSEPISLLAHNLNFWAPFLNDVIEGALLEMPLTEFEDEKDRKYAERRNKELPDGYRIDRPRMGGLVWEGEDEAWEVTKMLVEAADAKGNLRSIMDAVKSHRIEDDFSDRWSYEKEDFERKLYRKRSKLKVTFVEMDNAIPVHSPSAEVHEKLIWEDFFALLNPKEKQIVVCLKNGVTKLSEVGEILGYANHSPVSKAMKAIRLKAQRMLE